MIGRGGLILRGRGGIAQGNQHKTQRQVSRLLSMYTMEKAFNVTLVDRQKPPSIDLLNGHVRHTCDDVMRQRSVGFESCPLVICPPGQGTLTVLTSLI